VVDVADCADVDVRLLAFECSFSHVSWSRLFAVEVVDLD
jgi:hypothetical protein